MVWALHQEVHCFGIGFDQTAEIVVVAVVVAVDYSNSVDLDLDSTVVDLVGSTVVGLVGSTVALGSIAVENFVADLVVDLVVAVVIVVLGSSPIKRENFNLFN